MHSLLTVCYYLHYNLVESIDHAYRKDLEHNEFCNLFSVSHPHCPLIPVVDSLKHAEITLYHKKKLKITVSNPSMQLQVLHLKALIEGSWSLHECVHRSFWARRVNMRLFHCRHSVSCFHRVCS